MAAGRFCSNRRGKYSMKNLHKEIKVAAVVSCVSGLLMILIQIPTPDYLNCFGALFAVIWMAGGIYAAIGTLFLLTD
jgi:hypothetical protein